MMMMMMMEITLPCFGCLGHVLRIVVYMYMYVLHYHCSVLQAVIAVQLLVRVGCWELYAALLVQRKASLHYDN